MKTPRDILLARHRAAEPKLDAIRKAVLAKAITPAPEPRPPRIGAFALGLTLWREVILPSRRAWSGLAATWMLIALINLAESRGSQGTTAKPTAQSNMADSFIEQQKLLGELLTDRTPATDADRPKTFTPKPHTEATGSKMV